MDDTGHPAAVPGSHNGTGERAEAAGLGGWVRGSARPRADLQGGYEAGGYARDVPGQQATRHQAPGYEAQSYETTAPEHEATAYEPTAYEASAYPVPGHREPPWANPPAVPQPRVDPLSPSWPGVNGWSTYPAQPPAVPADDTTVRHPAASGPPGVVHPAGPAPVDTVPASAPTGPAPASAPPAGGVSATAPADSVPLSVPGGAGPVSAAPASPAASSAHPLGAVPATPTPYAQNLDPAAAPYHDPVEQRPAAAWADRQPPAQRGHAEFGDDSELRGMPVASPLDAPGGSAVDPPTDSFDVTPVDTRGVPATDPGRRRTEGLPQRVPAEPDVPALPDGVAEEVEARAETPELARIATLLRHDDPPPPHEDDFDVDAMLAAVREVPGVRDAELRRRPGRAHTLRLDLADGADAAQVSRAVARLLNERMGLAAALGEPMPEEETVPPAGPQTHGPAAAGAGPSTAAAQPSAPGAEQSAAVAQPPAAAEPPPEPGSGYRPRRLRAEPARGRAAVEPRPAGDDQPTVTTAGRAVAAPSKQSRPLPPRSETVRVVLDHVQVSTFGLDATVEVRLTVGNRRALGEAGGPAVDGYLLRMCATAAASAINQLLTDRTTGLSRGRCFIEHAAVAPVGSCDVAVVVVLLVCDGWVEQLSGSAIVAGDPRQAVVRATLAAVNRRLESLLS